MHSSILYIWKKFLESINESTDKTDKTYSVWHFCDDEKNANELARLVKNGIKRAASSLYCIYEQKNEPIPKLNEYSIIVNWDGFAQCIIKTTKVCIIPFKNVSDEFADLEGEGDKTLEYWRTVHWDFFFKQMESYGKEASEDMFIVCEEFELVYK